MSVTGGSNPGGSGEDLESTRWEDARHWMGSTRTSSVSRLESWIGSGGSCRGFARLPEKRPPRISASSRIRCMATRYGLTSGTTACRSCGVCGSRPRARCSTTVARNGELTKREYQLLQFLLDHPNRFFSSSQLVTQAWADAALYPEEARNYVRRIRKILTELDIPCDLVNRPGRGHSLIYRHDG